MTVQAPLECRDFFRFLCFYSENKLIPMKFLYNPFKIPAFQRGAQVVRLSPVDSKIEDTEL
jgi:hypothetical protein